MSSNSASQKVADAPKNIWVYRLLPAWVWPYAQLARWDRPIGWWLLLWPCWWSLVLAMRVRLEQVEQNTAADFPISSIVFLALGLFLFWLGAVVMRGAGCSYNDLVDLRIDAQVARTASRPIPSGRVSKKQTLAFIFAQALIGLLCLTGLCVIGFAVFNDFAMLLGIASLAIVAVYPFAKRVTDWPQLVLGLAFSWGALMGWAITFANLTPVPLLLYVGSILWVIGYDTMYAHQDKEDDALIGVRSTARLFGEQTKLAMALLYAGTLALFALAFYASAAGMIAYIGLALAGLHMIWQIHTLDINDADNCLALFRSNSKFGWILFASLMLDILI